MPRPIQTLPFAQALVQLFKSQGKAKLQSDDVIVPIVGVDITKAPFLADGAQLWETSRTLTAGVGFPSQVAIINGDGVVGQGIVIVDTVNVAAPAVAGDQLYVGFALATAGVTYNTTCFNVSRPFVSGSTALQRVPVGRDSSNLVATIGTKSGRYTISEDGSVFHGPWVLPGVVAQEEWWVSTVTNDKPLGVTVRGRYYGGMQFKAP